MAWTSTAVALTVVGTVLALAAVAVGVLCCRRRRQFAYSSASESPLPANDYNCLSAPETFLAERLLSRHWNDEREQLIAEYLLFQENRSSIGAATVVRCRLAVPVPSVDAQARQLMQLFSFARLFLQIDDTFFSGSKGLSKADSCLMSVVRLQTTIATAISVNRALDAIDGSQQDMWKQEWRETLEREVSGEIERLSQLLADAEASSSDSAWGLADDRECLQAAVTLYYELQEQDYGVVDQFPAVLPLISSGLSLVVESHDVTVPVSQPTWFDPCILLRRTWSMFGRQVWEIGLTGVGCSLLPDNSSASEEECIRRAALWSRLLHPNVVALEAASYVGTPFFVYAHGVPLAEAAKTRAREGVSGLKWTRLHEAALGLQYLQSRGVAFQALTPESILLVEMSSDTSAKRGHPEIDSAVCKVNCDRVVQLWWPNQPDHLGANDWRWLAPERLEDGPASLEADVFSFGMCILQVVMSGERESQWIATEQAIRDGELPAAITPLEDHERDLIYRMCARDPRDRVSISHVVTQLQRFAELETSRNEPSLSSLLATETPTSTSLKDVKLRGGLPIGDALAAVRLAGDHPSESDSGDLVAMLNSVLKRVDQLVASISTHSNGSIAKEDADKIADVVSRLVMASHRTSTASSASASASWLSASFAASTVIRRQVSDVCKSLHQQLDHILSSLDAIHQQNAVHSDWRTLWDVKPTVDSHVIEIDSNENQQDFEEQLIVLQFEVQHRASSYPEETVASMRLEIDRLEQRVGPRPLPIWFLPAYEVEFDAFDAFAQGSFGSVHRGRWLDSSVVVKKVFASGSTDNADDAADQAVFVREADIWSALKHANVVQLYGACHLRGWRFFVCEFAPFGTLDVYLRAQRTRRHADMSSDDANPSRVNVWRLLYGVGSGLKFLHQRGIAHGDLKCNNVLIGHNETPKLTDFGLSEAGKGSLNAGDGDSDGKRTVGAVGAYRWKAPEVLRGEVSTSCEADVFSFGMVIVEAVTGDVPWGRDLLDAAVKYHAINGQLPLRPRRILRGGIEALPGRLEDGATQGDEFADDEWELVQGMCRSDPSTRLPLREVVSRILQFSLRR